MPAEQVKAKPHNQPVILPPDYSDDFTYIMLSDKSGIVKASDGKEYNLIEIMLTKLVALEGYSPEGIGKIPDSFKNNLMKKLNSFDEIISVEKLFEFQTGEKYTKENIEKFLKGEVRLLAEKEFEKTVGRIVPYVPSPPYIRSDFSTDYEKNKLNKQRKTLTPKEQTYYAKIYGSLSKEMKVKFERCLKSGKLLQSNSNDRSTVLDNLYKIFSKPRAAEVRAKTILEECINILDNPIIITQMSEDIPEKYINKMADYVFGEEEKMRIERKSLAENPAHMMNILDDADEEVINKEEELKRIKDKLENRGVGTCAAASIEYTLATEHTAEFFRIIEGLTSEKKAVKKIINCNKANLTDDDVENFKTPHNIKNGRMEVTLTADKGAYILTDIQKNYQDDNERTTVDILIQSLIFQTATRGTYDSVSDKHAGYYGTDEGLCAMEEEYVLRIITGNDIDTNEYVDDDLKPISTGEKIEKDIDAALSNGKLVVVGLKCRDNDQNPDGHDLTIISKTKGLDGTEYYICKDTDEEYPRPVLIKKESVFKTIIGCNILK